MITIYHKSVKEKKIKTISKFKVGAWLRVYGPSEEELSTLETLLGVEKDLLSDALDPFEAPRLEYKKGITYVFVKLPQKENGNIKIHTLLVAFGEDFILTVSKEKINFLDELVGRKQVNTTQKTKFFLKLFSLINYQYNYLLLDINKKASALREKIEKIDNKDIAHFIDLEKILNDFLSVLLPTNNLLKRLLSGKYIPLYEDDKDLAEDLFLANGQLLEYTKTVLKYVVNIRSAYSNIINHDLNRVMKLLTALTIILTIPTIIFSFYGMNIPLPLSGSSFSAVYVLLFTFLFSGGVFLLFLKKDWL